MNCTTFNNNTTILGAVKANTEAFHHRLRQLYPCVDDVTKLPHAWSPDSKAPPLGLTYDDLGCYFRGNGRREDDEKFAAAVRTDHYIPPSCLLYYFEIKFLSKGREGFMGLGLTSAQVVLTKLPGWAKESYGYHADDGNIFNGDGRGKKFGPTFTTGDVIGCGYNLVEGKCFFTKNGLQLGEAFTSIPNNVHLYPTIGLKTPGEEIRANFGHEDFLYDISQDLKSLKKNMTLTISDHPISDFSTWQTTLHKLVQSWLLQNSYPSTADAFSRSTKLGCKENLQRVQQRNKIQQLVLSGRISEAIRLTNRHCPDMLQNNPNLLFALRCRQFIELISGAEHDFQHATIDQEVIDNPRSNGRDSALDDRDGGAGDTQSDTTIHEPSFNNGCNGMVGPNNNNSNNNNITNNSNNNNSTNNISNNNNSASGKADSELLTSSSSLQELMDIDQPFTSASTNSSPNNHRNQSESHLNHNVQQQILCSMDMNNGDIVNSEASREVDGVDDQKFARLIQFGRELNEQLQYLDTHYGKSETNEKMLQDAIGLIAFTNPKSSKLGNLLNPIEREPISQLLNSSIVKAEMGETHRLPMEEVMNHLRKLVRLNDSHGRWLIDRLY